MATQKPIAEPSPLTPTPISTNVADTGRRGERDASPETLLALRQLQSSERGYTQLSGSVHDVLGNRAMQSALSGQEPDGPGLIVQAAMGLGAAGVVVGDSIAGLLNNSTMQACLGTDFSAAADTGAATAAGPALAIAAKGAPGDPADGQWGAGPRRAVDQALGRGGHALPQKVSEMMGAALGGIDLSGVRIHTDAAAARASAAINARAFTVADQVYFGAGEYDPRSRGGQALLAHELTHVRQHREGRLPSGGQGGDLDVSSPYDAHEVEAERAAARAAQVLPALSSVLDGGPDALVHEIDALLEAKGAAGSVQDAGTGAPVPMDAAIAMLAQGVPMRSVLERLAQVFSEATGPSPLVARTDALIAELTAGMGLSRGDVSVQTDEAAAATARGAHARGLMAGDGEIALDAARYNPDTASGRGLLAHEVVHVAQENLSAAEGVSDAGRVAEVEAHTIADRFASGGGISAPQVGLPTGHVAAEGDLTGGDFLGAYQEYMQTLQAQRDGITPPEVELTSPGEVPTQNRRKKIRQYGDGVDGVADQIGDLDAFDELCDAVSDDEDTGPALSQVTASEPFDMLTQMWQGALDGGEDSGELQGLFNSEFDDRGFWGSTEDAFDLVESSAKSQPRRAEGAEGAEEELNAAEVGEAEAVVEEAPVEEVAQAPTPPPDPVITAEELEANRAVLDAVIEPISADVAPIPSFTALEQISDAEMDHIAQQNNHHAGMVTDLEAGSSRWDQVSSTLMDGFLGPFIQNGTDQFVDSAILDTVGMFGDMALKTATRGVFSTPMIGPIIGLVQSNPFSGEYYTQLGDTFGQGMEGLGNFGGNALAAGSALMEGNFTDAVAIFCAALADLFGGLAALIRTAQQIIGTLSALAYIAGGILIAIGICLVWFAGVGVPLITAGGWLVRAGGILARINTALGPINLILTGLATLFRGIAALTVPTEMYADQLAGVGEDAQTFGTAAGNKVGDTAGSAIKTRVENRVNRPTPGAASQDNDGESRGQSESQRRLAEAQATAQRLVDGQQGPRPDEDAARPRDDDAGTQRRGVGRRVIGFARDKVVEVGKSVRDLGQLFTDAGRSANDGLAGVQGPAREILQRRVQDIEARITAANSAIRDLIVLSEDPSMGAQRSAIFQELNAYDQQVRSARATIERIRSAQARAFDAPPVDQQMGTMRRQQQEAEVLRQRRQTLEAELRRIDDELAANRDDRLRIQEDIVAARRQEVAELERIASDRGDARARLNEVERSIRELNQQISRNGQDNAYLDSVRAGGKMNATIDGQTTSVDIVRFTDDGQAVVRIPDGSERTISVGDIPNRRISAALQRRAELGDGGVEGVRQQIADYNDQLPQLRLDSQGSRQSRERADRAQAEVDQGLDMNVERYATPADRRSLRALGRSDRSLNTRRSELEDDIGALDGDLTRYAHLDTPESQQRLESLDHFNNYAMGPRSGNSTGGTGSNYRGQMVEQGLYDHVFSLIPLLDDAARASREARAAAEGTEAEAPGSLGQAISSAAGIDPMSKEQILAMGRSHAFLESLANNAPPHDLEALGTLREEAATAYQQYADSHGRAYEANLARQAVQGMARETLELAEAGQTVKDRAVALEAPIQEGVATESERSARLAGQSGEVGEPDPGLTGIVGDLIGKLASNADNFDDQPGEVDPNTGAAVADAQTSAGEESTARQEQSAEASAQQRAFLDQAVALRTQQEESVDGNIRSLEEKHVAEMEIYGEIGRLEQQAISERDAHRATAEGRSSAFNAQYSAMKTWADGYLSQASGGEGS